MFNFAIKLALFGSWAATLNHTFQKISDRIIGRYWKKKSDRQEKAASVDL